MSDVNLDDPGVYKHLDPENMLRRVDDLAGQIESGWDLASQLTLPAEYRDVDNVVIAGMGGSAIGGSLIETYAAGDSPVPVKVWRGYGIPGFVGRRSLVIAISVSGNTEETLSAFRSARDADAKLIAISTGGEMSALATHWKVPLFRFSYDAAPRAALGYLLTPLLRIFEELEFLGPQELSVRAAVHVAGQALKDWGADTPQSQNEAKQMARVLSGRSAVVYGADHLAPVARRWKTQLNENSKLWAAFEEFSELNHNSVVGYEFPTAMQDHVLVVVLSGALIPDRMRIRMTVTQRLMDEYGVQWREVVARGADRLSEMISSIALGDYVSYYLALLNGADPTAIRPITVLKNALANE